MAIAFAPTNDEIDSFVNTLTEENVPTYVEPEMTVSYDVRPGYVPKSSRRQAFFRGIFGAFWSLADTRMPEGALPLFIDDLSDPSNVNALRVLESL